MAKNNGVDYRDDTPLSDKDIDDVNKLVGQDEYSSAGKKIANWLKTKLYGKPTRGAMALWATIIGDSTQKNHQIAKDSATKVDNIGQRFDDQIAGSTNDDEMIDLRHSDMLSKSFTTARKRGDFWDEDLQERAISVAWFGGTDSKTSIQDAINAASDLGGGTVFLPRGAYMIDQTITVKKGVTLAANYERVDYDYTAVINYGIIASANMSKDDHIIVVESGASLQNISVDCANHSAGIIAERMSLLQGVTCYRSEGTGIIIRGGNHKSITVGFAKGIGVNVSQADSTIFDLNIHGGFDTGLYVGKGANNSTFTGGKIEFNDGNNVSLNNSINNYFVNINIDRSGDYGIRETAGAQATFVNCQLWRSNKLDSENGSHIFLEGKSHLAIIGGNARYGVNDDSSGVSTPAHFVKTFETDSSISLIGVDAENGMTGTPFYGSPIMNISAVKLPNLGYVSEVTLQKYAVTDTSTVSPEAGTVVLDKVTGRLRMYNGNKWQSVNNTPSGKNYYSQDNVSVKGNSSTSISLKGDVQIGDYSRSIAYIKFVFRNSKNSSTQMGRIPIVLAKEGGAAFVSVGNIITEYGTPTIKLNNITVDNNGNLEFKIVNTSADSLTGTVEYSG